MKKSIVLFLGVLLLTSCVSKSKIVYLNEVEDFNYQINNVFEPKLQADDLLGIIVNSATEELASEFNRRTIAFQSTGENAVGTQRVQSYLINKDGFIDFPKIGKIKLAGLTKQEAENTIISALKPHILDVSINMRILNFKVTVQGEVARPATHNIDTERITLLQALSMSGDMTIYGNRKNVLIIRESEGKRMYNRIDVTTPEFMDSEFYYLQQNDIVYVEPNKTKVNSSMVGSNLTLAISAVSLLVTLYVAFIRN